MKNLRQLLRRPVRQCDATVSARYDQDGHYVITTTCPHLKTPRITRHRFLGDKTSRERAEQAAWDQANEDLWTHTRYRDPW